MHSPRKRAGNSSGSLRTFILALMFVAALTLLAASAVHASLLGPIDPFPGAAPPEALLGTVYGLTVTVPRGGPGDVAYHVSLLAGLIVAAGLLIRQRGLVD